MLTIATFLVALSSSLALPVQLVEIDPSSQDLQAEASEWVYPKNQIVKLEPVNEARLVQPEEEALETAETAHHGGGYGGYGGGHGGFGGGHGGFGGGHGGGFGHGGHGGHGGYGGHRGFGGGGFGGFGGFIGGFGGFGGGGGHHHGWGRR